MLLGLDIGSTALRACAISPSTGKERLELFDTEDLPAGAVVNGVISDSAQVVEALREILLRSSIESPQLAMSLPHSATRMVTMQLAQRRGRYDLRAAHAAIDALIPSRWGDYHLSIAPFSEEDPDSVLVVAAPVAAVRVLQHIAEQAGAPLVGIDAAPAVCFNVLAHAQRHQGDVAIVDVGLQESRILLMSGGQLRTSAVFPRGGQDLTESLQTVLKLNAEEAELYKIGGDQPSEGVVPRDVHDQLRVACQALAKGVSTTIQEAAQRIGIANLQSIQCLGRGADLPLFYDALKESSQTKVELLSPLHTLECNPFDYTDSYLDAVRGASGFAFGSVLPWTS